MTDISPPGAVSGVTRPLPAGEPHRILGQLRQARVGCQPECFGYHASWPICRRLGIKSHPGWHRDFLTAALTSHPAATIHPLDVVLAGAADDHLLTTLARIPLAYPARFHLIDRCATPLARNATTASRLGLHLTTHQRTLPTPPGTEGSRDPFGVSRDSADFIITDGLLSLLPSRAAVDDVLAEAWHLLRPGGRFCYTTRLTAHPGQSLEYDRAGKVLQAATTLTCLPTRAAGRWAATRATWSRPARPAPFTTTHDLHSALTGAGFTVTDLRIGRPSSVLLAVHPRRLTAPSTIVQLRAERPLDRP